MLYVNTKLTIADRRKISQYQHMQNSSPCPAPSRPDHAISSWHNLPGTLPALPFCLIRYDAADFDPAAFLAQGIHRPPAIAASVQKRQAEYFHGRLAARQALLALEIGATNIPSGPAREPLWPDGVVGSITHTRRFAAAVALRRQGPAGVGIDIEDIVDDDMREAIAATALSQPERAYLGSIEHLLALNTLITIVFSAKESLYKGAYSNIGHFFDFSAAQVSEINLDEQWLVLTLAEPLSPIFTRASQWKIHFEFIAAQTVMTSFTW